MSILKFMATYDLKKGDPSPYREFVKAAEEEGLLYVYSLGDELCCLPNTTLWGEFEAKDSAREAFDRALAAASKKLGYSIVLEKRVITAMSELRIRSNVKKTPIARWVGHTDFDTCRLHQQNDPYFAY